MRRFFRAAVLATACGLAAVAAAEPLGFATAPQALATAALGADWGTAEAGVWRGGSASHGFASRTAETSVDAGASPGAVDAGAAASAVDAGAAPSAVDAGASEGRNLFEIGSLSKVFTGLLLAQAVERGELALEDTLGRLLEGKVAFSSPEAAAITLGQLVTHTSCLPRLPADFRSNTALDNPYRSYDRARLWAALGTLKLSTAPPCAGSYSNMGFAVLGEVLAERSGKPWEALVRERIAEPLGMADTRQHLGDQAPRLALGFDDREPAAPWDFQAFAGAGALRSSTADLLLFSRALLAGAAGPLGKAAERLLTPLAAFDGASIGYAVLIREHEGRRTILHMGGTGGYRALWMLAPDTQEALALLASNAEVDLAAVQERLLASRYPVPGEAAAGSEPALAAYQGVFRANRELAFAFVAQEGVLHVRIGSQEFQPLVAAGADRFTRAETGLDFRFVHSAGRVASVVAAGNGATVAAARSDEAAPARATLPDAMLQAYAGRYRLAPGAEFDVRVQAGHLAVKLTRQPRYRVYPTAQADRFAYEVVPAELQFERPGGSQAAALVLHQGGMQQRAPRVAP